MELISAFQFSAFQIFLSYIFNRSTVGEVPILSARLWRIMSAQMMNMIYQYPVDAVYLRAAVKRDIMGDVDFITSSREGWTVHLQDANDLTACTVDTWAGRPVKYEAHGIAARSTF